MVTNKELSYRSIDELLSTVSVDMRSYYSDGVIEIAELIKIAIKINYELGLQINQTKETVLDINGTRAKMPADFEFLNFAMLCHKHSYISPLFPPGLVKEECIVSDNLETNDCECHINPLTTCSPLDPDPWKQGKVRTMCNDQIEIKVQEVRNDQILHYEHVEPLFLEPCRRASSFCSNNQFRQRCGNIAYLRDKFLEIPVTKECGKVYINYQGMLQDDNGDLLVLDHPVINMYYEAAVKHRILENLYINGEPDIERRLAYMEKKMMIYKQDAMNIVYMPDFKVICQTYQKIRDEENSKHFAPLSKFMGFDRLSSDINYMFNGRYRQ